MNAISTARFVTWLLAAPLLAAVSGCARVPARPPASEAARPGFESAPEENASTGADAARTHAGALDPSEEITPEELASIPDPVPDSDPIPRSAGATDSVWRVQVFASASRAEAERVAAEASAALGAPFVIEQEFALHKVRLGRFDTEAEAEPLRERAIEAGYHGAFRVRAFASSSARMSKD